MSTDAGRDSGRLREVRAGFVDRGVPLPLAALLAVTVVALLVRVVALGGRVFHWDEGRVGYWILRYAETGEFAYRPIIHGPFLPVVNEWVFAVLPATDASARLVVAVVGGLLPLAAWLFRDHLRDAEVVALGLILAANPLLVYYSRFMRNDVLVAAFSLVALGAALRWLATGRRRYPLLAGVALAAGFAAKENAVVYVVCFAGAGALVVDHRLFRRTTAGESALDVAADWLARVEAAATTWGDGDRRAGLVRLAAGPAVFLVSFLAVVVFFYAPRPELWTALGEPGRLPGLVGTATLGTWEKLVGSWLGGSHQSHDYLPYLYDFLETLVFGAPVVLALAAFGFAADGYLEDGHSRDVVAFATYWGAVSVLGYPIATDIPAPWVVVHAVVPLAIPAAVGGVAVGGLGLRAHRREDARSVAVAALLVLAAVGGVAALNVDYWNSAAYEDRQVLQYAQPGNDLQRTLADARAIAVDREGDEPTVLFYGTVSPHGDDTLFYVENESSLDAAPPGGPNWHSRLPLPWYFEQYGAEVTSTPPPPDDPALDDPPPVVVAHTWNRSDLEPQLPGYEVREHRFRLWGERVVVFVDRAALADARE
jgi:uncharacterized protein (TIGR03663 family)